MRMGLEETKDNVQMEGPVVEHMEMLTVCVSDSNKS